QCSAASTWRCLGSLVATTASDAKSTTYKKKNNNTNSKFV
uniref:Uncharacterized protein n=1 Tax=Amphimedon queenslandica TaxID=400682 RepID=I1E8B2_AMPQE